MRTYLAILCALVAVCFAQDHVCRAIAFGGGGDRGAYEAGAFKALVEFQTPDKVRYDVVTGISAGSWNSAGLSQFKIGDEKAAAAYLEKTWLNTRASDVWKHWFPGGPLEGLFLKSGVLDSSPMQAYIKKNVDLEKTKASGRTINIGATCLDRNTFVLFNETFVDFHTAVIASSSIPGIFPTISINGENYVDGGIEYMTPVSDAIALCMAKYNRMGINKVKVSVDVILAVADLSIPKYLSKLLITPFVLVRSFLNVIKNIFVEDVQTARMSFPNAEIRVIKPLEWLPGYFLGFDRARELLDWGYADAKRVLNETSNSWF
ncbi:hypothetical protein AKO1_008060 [Acrasis kona]|uniref:PNPLA domain-containing protein n=1 Tax=Acrasis kona TaxID=1008807 RepID=A0AAW2YQ49_9EUKA